MAFVSENLLCSHSMSVASAELVGEREQEFEVFRELSEVYWDYIDFIVVVADLLITFSITESVLNSASCSLASS